MPSASGPLRIFIGANDSTRLESLVLGYSLRTRSRRPLDLALLNATRGVLEHNGRETPLPLWSEWRRHRGTTDFGFLRWLVPALAGHRGRALYLDSDMLCLADVAELFDRPLDGAQFLAMPSELGRPDWPLWRTSVMPMDCAATDFPLEEIFEDVRRGRFAAGDFLQLAPNFLALYPYRIGRLEPAWNHLDGWDSSTRLLHFTDLARQPWRFPDHPQGKLWFDWLRSAIGAGAVQAGDLAAARAAGALGEPVLRCYGGLP